MASRRASSSGHDPTNGSSAAAPVNKTPIPPLISVAPSIFTPMPEGMFDFLAGPNPTAVNESLRDRVARLRHILATLDYQRAGVRDNMLYMFDREKERLIQWAEAFEAAAAVPEDPSLPNAEVDELIAAMEAPADARVNYSLGREEVGQMVWGVRQRQAQQGQRGLTARETAMEDIFRVVESSLGELVGYDGHIMNIRRMYAERLVKEEALISEAGLRPEERVLGR